MSKIEETIKSVRGEINKHGNNPEWQQMILKQIISEIDKEEAERAGIMAYISADIKSDEPRHSLVKLRACVRRFQSEVAHNWISMDSDIHCNVLDAFVNYIEGYVESENATEFQMTDRDLISMRKGCVELYVEAGSFLDSDRKIIDQFVEKMINVY